ncbi:unnamed protein product, partial [Didymodactylos carnosus]
MLLVPM